MLLRFYDHLTHLKSSVEVYDFSIILNKKSSVAKTLVLYSNNKTKENTEKKKVILKFMTS